MTAKFKQLDSLPLPPGNSGLPSKLLDIELEQ